MKLWLAAFLILLTGCIQSTKQPQQLIVSNASTKVSTIDDSRMPALLFSQPAVHRYPINTNQVCQTNLVIGWANSTGCISDVWISGDLMHWKLHSSVTNVGAVTYLSYVINEPPPCVVRVENR